SNIYDIKIPASFLDLTTPSTPVSYEVIGIAEGAFAECRWIKSVTLDSNIEDFQIGDNAFSGCRGLTSVEIPGSITSIGSNAFTFCVGLVSVSIPSSVSYIGADAFLGCEGLKKAEFASVESFCNIEFGSGFSNPMLYTHRLIIDGEELKDFVIPDFITSISSYAFSGCRDLTSVKIPDSVAKVGDGAFYGCSGLTSIEIPISVTEIGYAAFYGCSRLTSLIIPKYVNKIGDNAFYECYGLKKVAYPNTLTDLSLFWGIGIAYSPNDDIIENNWIFGPDKSSIVFVPLDLTGEYTIPSSVMSIGDAAFYGCKNLTSVIIPSSVTSIGSDAFYNCEGLKKVEFASVESLCNISFESCTSNPLYYAHSLFIGGEEIVDLFIPDSIKYIRNYAFSGCSGLSSVKIPVSVTEIGIEAFRDCSGLSSVFIPNYVNQIGVSAFYGCTGLIKCAYPTTLDDPFRSGLIYGYNPKKITIDDLNNMITNDGKELTFVGYNRDGKYEVPSSVTEIGRYAYGYLPNLSVIDIPNDVTAIGTLAFAECSSLTDVYLPSKLETLGETVFENCDAIKNVIYRGAMPVEGSPDMFESKVYDEATLYIPNGSKELFMKTIPWRFFLNIVENSTTGIYDGIDDVETGEDYTIYTLNGLEVSNPIEELAPGIYIIRQGTKVKKINVK
ncbi:MAG: leucine-rich repeat domain-containing protein, partial [Muribaculaceae bacterium]|nr:leucine-rich repeat domain-containing protein [Muribaculaceae bacterium]